MEGGVTSSFGGFDEFEKAEPFSSGSGGGSHGFDSFDNTGVAMTTSSGSDPFSMGNSPSSVPVDIKGVLGSPKGPGTGATAMDAYFNSTSTSAGGATSTNRVKNVGESQGS